MPEIRKLKTVNTWIDDGVGVLQLNYPEKRNTLGWQIHYDLLKVMEEYKANKDVACILLYGTEEYFSSGWALDVLESTGGNERQGFSDIALKLMIGVYDYPKPTIAAVAGICPGYGLDIANMADIKIASRNASFVCSQVKYGLNPMYHPMYIKIGSQRARRMVFSGHPMGAEEAHRVGLVDELTPVGQLYTVALKLAKDIAEQGSEHLTTLKEVALRATNMDHVGATAYETRITNDLLARPSFIAKARDGLKRIKEKRSRAIERLGRL